MRGPQIINVSEKGLIEFDAFVNQSLPLGRTRTLTGGKNVLTIVGFLAGKFSVT